MAESVEGRVVRESEDLDGDGFSDEACLSLVETVAVGGGCLSLTADCLSVCELITGDWETLRRGGGTPARENKERGHQQSRTATRRLQVIRKCISLLYFQSFPLSYLSLFTKSHYIINIILFSVYACKHARDAHALHPVQRFFDCLTD